MSECTEYVLDGNDRILEVGGDWDAFARANNAEHLCGDALIGTSFWDHIAGQSLCDLLHRVFQRARSLGQPITVPARCDSPDTIRHLEIRVHALNSNQLRVQSCVRSEIPRENWRSGDRVRAMLQMCSWCNRFNHEGRWMEIEEAIEKYDLVNADVVPRSSHGICPDCAILLKKVAMRETLNGIGLPE
jgi:hypothetical protein